MKMSGSHHDPPNWDLLRTQDRQGTWQKETSKIRRTLELKKETKLLHKMAGLDSKNENDIFLLHFPSYFISFAELIILKPLQRTEQGNTKQKDAL